MTSQIRLSPAEARLVRLSRINTVVGVVVIAAMFVIIALLAFALYRATTAAATAKIAAQEVADLSYDNCFNIEVNRTYYDTLDRIITTSIRQTTNAGQPVNPLIRQWVDAVRLARNSMITTDCQEAQG